MTKSPHSINFKKKSLPGEALSSTRIDFGRNQNLFRQDKYNDMYKDTCVSVGYNFILEGVPYLNLEYSKIRTLSQISSVF